MKRKWTTEDNKRFNTISNGYMISVSQAIRGVIVSVAQQDQGQEYREIQMSYAVADTLNEDKLDEYTTIAAKAHKQCRKIYHRSTPTPAVAKRFKYQERLISVKG